MKALTLFLFIFISTAALAQSGSIQGTVTLNNGSAVIGAYITVTGGNYSSSTDENGSYTIKNLPYGTYTLQIRSSEIKDREITVQLNKAIVTVATTVEAQDAKLLDEVVINEQSAKAAILDKGYAANVIDTKGASLQSIQTNELLDRSAGVRVRQNGGLGSNVQYNINGMSGNSVRVFIDGISISNYGPSFSLNSIPPSLIERIEVYKGVVPAYLSDDALGGAINIVLKNSALNTLAASYSFGSFNTHQANLTGNYRAPSGLTVRGSVFYNYSDNSYKVWGDQVSVITDPSQGTIEYVTARRFHDGYKSFGTKVDVGFSDVKWADQFFVGVVYSDMDKDIQHGAIMNVVYGNRRTEQTTKMASTTYVKNNLFTKGLDASAYASYSELKDRVIDTIADMYNWYGDVYRDLNGNPLQWASGAEAGRPTLNENHEKTFVTRANVMYNFNDNNRLGTNVLINHFNRKPNDPLLPAAENALQDTSELQKSILGFYYENEAFGKKLKTSVFYKNYRQKLNFFDARMSGGVVTSIPADKLSTNSGYGLVLSYKVMPKIMLTASTENAIRFPVSNEVFGNVSENIDPATNLEPEESRNANLGFILGPYTTGLHRLGLNFNAFYRDTKNMIRQGRVSQTSETFSYENLEAVLSTGFDAEFNYAYNQKLFVTLNASNFNARFNTQFDADGSEYLYYRQRIRNAPYLTANSNIRYNIDNVLQKESKTSFYYNVGYVEEFFRDWPGIGSAGKSFIPTQVVHDFGLAYTFPGNRVTASADAKNIFNRQVFDNWALQKPGRAFFIKLNYKLY